MSDVQKIEQGVEPGETLVASKLSSKSRSSRTLLLCTLDLLGAWALAYVTRSPELVYAYGLVAAGALGVWVGGKGVASYHQVLASRAPGNGGAP